MKKWAVLLVFLASPVNSAEGDLVTAHKVMGYCQKLEPTIMSPTIPNEAESGLCYGIFLALTGMLISDASGEDRPRFGVCPPRGVTTNQMILVFLRDIRAHPEEGSEAFLNMALPRLREAFPCPAK